MSGSLGDLFRQIQGQTQDQYGSKSWWSDYQNASSGGKDSLESFMQSAPSKYSDWDSSGSQLASNNLSVLQDQRPSSPFGINEFPKETGSYASGLAKAGMAAAALYAGGAYLGGALGGSAAGAGEAAGAGAAGSGALDTSGFGSMFDAGGYPQMPPASPMMPAAVPETPATLSQWGMTQTGPGEWTQTEGYTPRSLPSFSQNNNGLGGQQGGMLPHRQPVLLMQQSPPFVPVYPGALSPFLQGY